MVSKILLWLLLCQIFLFFLSFHQSKMQIYLFFATVCSSTQKLFSLLVSTHKFLALLTKCISSHYGFNSSTPLLILNEQNSSNFFFFFVCSRVILAKRLQMSQRLEKNLPFFMWICMISWLRLMWFAAAVFWPTQWTLHIFASLGALFLKFMLSGPPPLPTLQSPDPSWGKDSDWLQSTY